MEHADLRIKPTEDAVATALAQLATLRTTLTAYEQTLQNQLRDRQAQYSQVGSILAQQQGLDPTLVEDALVAFLNEPYIVLPMAGQLDRYWVIIPKFVGLPLGWIVRETATYYVCEISRFLFTMGLLPDWMQQLMPFSAAPFAATIDGLALTITEGDVSEVAQQLGRSFFTTRRGNTLYLKADKRLDVLRRLIRDYGILPYRKNPVSPTSLHARAVARTEDGTDAFTLRADQQASFEEFLGSGSLSLFAAPQTGKSFVVLEACARLVGPKLIIVPRRALVEQWRDRLALYLNDTSAGNVIVTTYQSAKKYLKQAFTLVVFDEAQHLPANFALETAMLIQTTYRMALSASPYREDGQEYLIPLLGGFPTKTHWVVRPNQRPTVDVWIVKTTERKYQRAQDIAGHAIHGKTILFVQYLQVGMAIAARLGIPFVHGQTNDPRTVIDREPMVVVSSVADEGLSIENIQRIIEVDFHGSSRMQAMQRAGRLGNVAEDAERGEYHVIMTNDEFLRFRRRLLPYAGAGFDITIHSEDTE